MLVIGHFSPSFRKLDISNLTLFVKPSQTHARMHAHVTEVLMEYNVGSPYAKLSEMLFKLSQQQNMIHFYPFFPLFSVFFFIFYVHHGLGVCFSNPCLVLNKMPLIVVC